MNLLKPFLFGYFIILSTNTYSQCNKDYELSWSDEFDATEVNLDNWVVKEGGGGFGNQEIQYYQPENASVSDGLLHIKIANETVNDGSSTYNYTSAKLETASKINFKYGKIEARIKMPDAVGSWPAFWMLGSNVGEVGWPHCGEIDIMEWVGRGPNAATGSIFFDGIWPANHLSTPYNIPEGQSFITDFHTFGIEWEPNEIRYYCDGNHYATYKNSSISPKEWVFNHEFFLILNCAIGGTGGGGLINIPEPKYMEIDYVRVYSLPGTADEITLTGSKNLMENSQNVLYTTNYFPNTTYEWTLPNGATIVDGLGTNAIHVNFTTEGGKVKVKTSNSCDPLADSLTVKLITDECEIKYDNFEDARLVSYQTSGTLVEDFTNPLQDIINSSTTVAKYERNSNEMYDVVGVNDIALENALVYENNSRILFLDILTSAPIGTQITLQLENSRLNAGAYPQGRRSSFIGYVSKQNEWHTVKFTFSSIINSGTSPDQVDYIALLFDPGHTTGDIYFFDNFKRLKSSPECPTITTDIKDSESKNWISIYPNPVTNILTINEKVQSNSYTIYNHLGEKVIEKNENYIDVTQLPSGIYFLKTENNTLKFVKQ